MKFKQSNLLEWKFKPEIKIGIKTIKIEINSPQNAVTPERLEAATPRSRINH